MVGTQYKEVRSNYRSVLPRRGEYMTQPVLGGGLHCDDGGYKPASAFWTSTYTPKEKYPSDWIRWCASEMPSWTKGKGLLLYPKENVKVHVIDSLEDMRAFDKKYHGVELYSGQSFASIYWIDVAKDFDGVQLTERGQYETRFPTERGLSLYGWDCESTAWFRHSFERVERLLWGPSYSKSKKKHVRR